VIREAFLKALVGLNRWSGSEIEKASRAHLGMVSPGYSRILYPEERKTAEQQAAQQKKDEYAYELIPEVNYKLLYATYKNTPVVRACVDIIARSATSRGYYFEPTGVGASESDRTILEEFFEEPSPEFSTEDLLESAVGDMEIFGDDFWEIVWEGGTPREIWPLNPVGTKIVADAHGTVLGYSNKASNFPTVYFDPHEVCHFRLQKMIANSGGRQGGSLFGLSPLESLILTATMEFYAVSFLRSFLKGGAKTRGLFAFGDANREQMKQNEEWLAAASKPENSGRDLTLTGKNVKYEKIGQSPKDQDLMGIRKFSREEVMMVYQVPPSMISLIETGNIGSGTGEAQQENFRENTIIPVQRKVERRVNQRVVRGAFGIKGWRMRLYPPEIVSELTQANIDVAYLNARDSSGESPISATEVRAARRWEEGRNRTVVPVEKSLKPSDVAVRTGRSTRFVEITRELERDLKFILKEQARRIARAFTQETRDQMAQKMTESLGDKPFELRFVPAMWGEIEFRKYSWPSFMKQQDEVEQALAGIDAQELSETIGGHYVALAEESLKNVARMTRQQRIELAAATREQLLAQAGELSQYVIGTLADAARAEIVSGIEAGDSIDAMRRRLQGLDTTEIAVRPRGEQAHGRRRDFATVAETIARTESRRVFTEVGKQQMQSAGIERVTWLASSDRCPVCEPFAGKDYDIGAIPLGGPPAHHNCRCTLQPIIPAA